MLQKYKTSDFKTYKNLLILFGLIDEMNLDVMTFAEFYELNG